MRFHNFTYLLIIVVFFLSVGNKAQANENDCTAFLMPHFDNNSESYKYIKKIYKKIFEIELESCSTDKRSWPKKRSFFLFEKWFYIEFHSEVLDVLGTGIERRLLITQQYC